MKYISIGFLIAFFIVITVVGLNESDKPATGHSHLHATNQDDKYLKKEKLPEHVKRDNILFEVY